MMRSSSWLNPRSHDLREYLARVYPHGTAAFIRCPGLRDILGCALPRMQSRPTACRPAFNQASHILACLPGLAMRVSWVTTYTLRGLLSDPGSTPQNGTARQLRDQRGVRTAVPHTPQNDAN